MMKQSLVALETNHIRGYVFETNRLQEIRGASTILDALNRKIIVEVARKEFKGEQLYAKGGSGLFLIEGDVAYTEAYGQLIQAESSKILSLSQNTALPLHRRMLEVRK